MEHHQTNWGRPRNDIYGSYDMSIHNAEPRAHTQQPTVTGSSVIAVKFDKGIVMAADTLACYGSLRRFDDTKRLLNVGGNTVVGVGGDVSDMQAISEILDNLDIEENYDCGGYPTMTAPSIHMYLRRLMYGRRSKMDPLWNAVLVGGLKDGKPFLGYVDLLGVTYEAPALASGFGSYLALPLLRNCVDSDEDVPNVTEEQARKAVAEGMKVLFYRDARAIDSYDLAVVTAEGVKIESAKVENQNWAFAKDIRGFGSTQRA